MLSDKKEIEIIFKNAEQILIDKPELAEMNLEDVINALDGNERMIRDRWGVAALLVIKSKFTWVSYNRNSYIKQNSISSTIYYPYEHPKLKGFGIFVFTEVINDERRKNMQWLRGCVSCGTVGSF